MTVDDAFDILFTRCLPASCKFYTVLVPCSYSSGNGDFPRFARFEPLCNAATEKTPQIGSNAPQVASGAAAEPQNSLASIFFPAGTSTDATEIV